MARVARYLAGALARFGADARAVFAEVNGEPAILGLSGDVLIGVMVLEMSSGEITALRSIGTRKSCDSQRGRPPSCHIWNRCLVFIDDPQDAGHGRCGTGCSRWTLGKNHDCNPGDR